MKLRDIKRRKTALLLATEVVTFRMLNEHVESLVDFFESGQKLGSVLRSLDLGPIEQRVIAACLQQVPKNFMGAGRLFTPQPGFQILEGR